METIRHATKFLPARRSSDAEILRQRRLFEQIPLFNELSNAVTDIFIVLNVNRQIVGANDNLVHRFGFDREEIFGLRPGELFDCIYAFKEAGGCGTSEFCKMCGAADAIARSLTQKRTGLNECQIRRKPNLGSLDLLVKATPYCFQGEDFSIFVVKDIGHEKRRMALEQVFFHDILNLAGNVMNLADLLKVGLPEKRERYQELLYRGARMLIDEIVAQKQLAAAERDDLALEIKPVDSLELIEELADLYRHHKTAMGKSIVVEESSRSVVFVTDKVLLARVLGNMIKNALEASAAGEAASVGCQKLGDSMEFRVRNQAVMPRNVRLQVFQRSFSTKSQDRGLGTYSMKLFVEKYLGGSVDFVSDRENGTVFRARLPVHPEQGDIENR